MAKKNFDDFVNAAGKRKKPSPEEVDELSKIIHQPELPSPAMPKPEPLPEIPTLSQPPAAAPQPVVPTRRNSLASRKKRSSRNEEAPGGEKVRITVDLAKDLYKRMKMNLVLEESDISSYIRALIERDLARK